MSDVATDLFQIGKNDYIALVDRYSGWPMCAKLRSKTTESVNQSYYIYLDTNERFFYATESFYGYCLNGLT